MVSFGKNILDDPEKLLPRKILNYRSPGHFLRSQDEMHAKRTTKNCVIRGNNYLVP